jgi:hypothetical protein
VLVARTAITTAITTTAATATTTTAATEATTTAAEATTATAAITTAFAAAAATWAAFFARTSFVNSKSSVLELEAIQSFDSFGSILIANHFDETEAA